MSASVYIPSFGIMGSAVPAQYNGAAEGRPSLTITDDNQVIMAWRYSSGECHRIAIALGAIVEREGAKFLSFYNYASPALTADSHITRCAVSDPALSTNGRAIYIEVVQTGTGAPLHSWTQVFYVSRPDTYAWQERSRIVGQVRNDSVVALATNRSSTLIQISMTPQPTVAPVKASMLSGADWTDIDPWLGLPPAVPHFGLAAFGGR